MLAAGGSSNKARRNFQGMGIHSHQRRGGNLAQSPRPPGLRRPITGWLTQRHLTASRKSCLMGLAPQPRGAAGVASGIRSRGPEGTDSLHVGPASGQAHAWQGLVWSPHPAAMKIIAGQNVIPSSCHYHSQSRRINLVPGYLGIWMTSRLSSEEIPTGPQCKNA